MKELLRHFPKQIALPFRIKCNDIEDFLKRFEHFTGTYPKIYFQLYNLGKNGEKTEYPYIHLTAFDIDNDNTKYENMVKMHEKLDEMDLKHCVAFSTNGFWIYILNKNYEKLIHPKGALTNAHDWFADQFGLNWGNAHDDDLDISIRGDIQRIGRMIGSYDIERGRYCYSLTEEDIKLGMEHIIEKSKTYQSININWFGNNEFDISAHDQPILRNFITSSTDFTMEEFKSVPIIEYDFEDRYMTPLIKSFMPMIQNWLSQEGGTTWDQRYWTTVYLVQLRIPDDVIERISRNIYIKQPRTDLYRTNYDHWRRCSILKQAKKETMQFPRFQTLYDKGLIQGVSKEDYIIYNNLLYRGYYPIDKLFGDNIEQPVDNKNKSTEIVS